MLNSQVGEHSVFLYSEDIELMFAAQSILLDEPVHTLCTDIYGPETIAALKRKYHFLQEVFKTFVGIHTNGMFEHLLDYPLADFTLNGFLDYLLGLEPAIFIKQFLDLGDMDTAVLERAVNNDKDLEELFFDRPELCTSYLGLQSFFRQTRRYIEEYFALAVELRTKAFAEAVKAVEPDLMQELDRARTALKELPPLDYSQKIMGKTFHNRGPYQSFTFFPSLLVPYRAIRFFGRDQILFYSIRPRPLQDEEMINQLKVLADNTRFKIITLLGEKGSLRGMDIAEALSVAPSTVSHHMDQLKKAGLLNEEQVKNAKYYSISKNNVNELLKRLTDTLGK